MSARYASSAWLGKGRIGDYVSNARRHVVEFASVSATVDMIEHQKIGMVMAGNIKLFLSLTLIGLIVVFSIQNVAEVEVQFLFWSFTTRRAFLIFVVLTIGILIGWIVHSLHRRARRRDSEGSTDDASDRTLAARRHDAGNDDR